MSEHFDVKSVARREAAQLLADFALHLKTITGNRKNRFVDADDIDHALGAVVTTILTGGPNRPETQPDPWNSVPPPPANDVVKRDL